MLSDLSRAVAAGASPPAISLAVICRDGSRMAALSRALTFFAPDIEVGPLTIRIVDRAGQGRAAVGSGAPPDADGRRLVEIDPGDSFGSGHHASTLQCLREVVRMAAPGRAVLDVGTGSGILAVAASALGAGPVVAVDVDPEAIGVAAANARVNRVAVEVVGGTVAAIRGMFDLVVANLGGADAPISWAPDLGAVLRPGGTLVLAGLLEEQADTVRRAYADWGTTNAAMEEGWACLTITKVADAPGWARR